MRRTSVVCILIQATFAVSACKNGGTNPAIPNAPACEAEEARTDRVIAAESNKLNLKIVQNASKALTTTNLEPLTTACDSYKSRISRTACAENGTVYDHQATQQTCNDFQKQVKTKTPCQESTWMSNLNEIQKVGKQYNIQAPAERKENSQLLNLYLSTILDICPAARLNPHTAYCSWDILKPNDFKTIAMICDRAQENQSAINKNGPFNEDLL